MRLRKLKATKVHGYLELDIDFKHDLTFLIGPNGSGKTSALRLLLGLLEPSFFALSTIQFRKAEVEIEANSRRVTVAATRTKKGIALQYKMHAARRSSKSASNKGSTNRLFLSANDLQQLQDNRRPGDSPPPAFAKIQDDPTVHAIQEFTTPMFLGLDRRSASDGYPWDPRMLRRERDLRYLHVHLRAYREEYGEHFGAIDESLSNVLSLVRETYATQQAKKGDLDKQLREDIVVSAFTYTPRDYVTKGLPSADRIKKLKAKEATIRKAAENLSIPQIGKSVDAFYEEMEKLRKRVTGPGRKRATKDSQQEEAKALTEWFLAQSQVDRILDLVQRVEDYAVKRDSLFKELEAFSTHANEFLEQTGKHLVLDDRGFLLVEVNGERRPLYALSSGERQIVVMLAHLGLNPQLASSGIFIVDEPELSLHLSWQEKFVQAVQLVNPDIQVVLATHSPAIILDLQDHCVPLGKKGRS